MKRPKQKQKHIPRVVAATLLISVLVCRLSPVMAQDKPSIVLVFLDNFGWGAPGFDGGGIIRDAPTPPGWTSWRARVCV